jgi:[CysO sulfur-carrier protein]-S-L-cysteine hydrolase
MKKSCSLYKKLKIDFAPSAIKAIREACIKSGEKEIGGMLFAQHTDVNTFRILEITAASENPGNIFNFLRELKYSLKCLQKFFERHQHKYTEYNYLGEWHSHPSFELIPSSTDDATMLEIIEDQKVGAYFAVLLIVKIQEKELIAKAWAYYLSGEKIECVLNLNESK